MLRITLTLALILFPALAGAEQVLNCATDTSGQTLGCYVLADHLRIESYQINGGACATSRLPRPALIPQPMQFLDLSPQQRGPMTQSVSALTAMIDDHAVIYLDYPTDGPVIDAGDTLVTRQMDQLLGKFLLADGSSFASVIATPRAAITAQDWRDILAFVADPVLGSYDFGAYVSLTASCPIQDVTIRANGADLRWQMP